METTRTTPAGKDSRSPCPKHNLRNSSSASSRGSIGFVASPVDFKCIDANTGGKTSNRQRVQWLVDVQRKAHGMYMQAAHSHTQRAKSRVGRLPIDCDDSDEGTSETENEEAVKVSSLLDRVAACMAAVSAAGGGHGDESCGADWREPGQLEAFLSKCLESWKAHNDMLAAFSQTQELMQQSRDVASSLKLRLQEAEEHNELLRWYAGHLKGSHGGGSPTTTTMATDILQEAKEAKKAVASVAAA